MAAMKVLCLTSFPIEAACTRYRCTQFFDYLRRQDVQCTLRPFLSPALFRRLYTPGGWRYKIPRAAAAVARRTLDLLGAGRYDVLFVQREAALFGPPAVEWIAAKILRKPMVFDLDDAIFVSYVSPTYGRLAQWMKFPGKTAVNIRMSSSVIAGNEYLAAYARKLNPRVITIPTVVDTGKYVRRCDSASSDPIRIGWIGSPTTTQYLKSLIPVFEQLAHHRRFVLKIVGANRRIEVKGVTVAQSEWELQRETADFQSLDIGVYPIAESEWSVGKSGFKAVQYMASGVPCVASPVGAVLEIIQDRTNGLLAATAQEWLEKLKLLIDDAALRAQLAENGRRTVEQRYSTAVHAPRLLEAIRSAACGL
jgi:glycosyltransferase involved in cell wall biosynthesis